MAFAARDTHVKPLSFAGDTVTDDLLRQLRQRDLIGDTLRRAGFGSGLAASLSDAMSVADIARDETLQREDTVALKLTVRQ